ncbi:MAG: hypothetical protein R3C03_01140 [Pirellulaceae bacterium]
MSGTIERFSFVDKWVFPLRFWSRFLYAGQKTFSASSRGWWGGVVEIGLATILIFAGFLFLVAALAMQYLYSDWTANSWHYSAGELALRLSVAGIALAIGVYRMLVALWRVSVSEERREAIATAASDFDIFREEKSENWIPNLPKLARPPIPGTRLRYRLQGKRRRYIWLLFTAFIALVGLGISTVLVTRVMRSWNQGQIDYQAAAVAFFSAAGSLWAAIGFVRQAMRMTAFGPTSLELSEFPLRKGKKIKLLLFQPGRFRFKLLDVVLVCEEVTTFSRGTDIQSERRTVCEERLFRHRGVDVTPEKQFVTDVEFELPANAMHSFSAKNNQIQWKIVVQTTAKGWPKFEQVFPILVFPPKNVPLESQPIPYESESTN